MEIFFLGTNGWYDTSLANTICTLIKAPKFNIILDAGDGIYKIDKLINKNNPTYLFLSHFHLDHISGFHILDKFKFRFGLHVYGQKGIKKLFKEVIAKPYSMDLGILPYKVFIHEIEDGEYNLGFSLEVRELVHSTSCLGYRFVWEGKSISYCTDTGLCKNAFILSREADLLISECSLKPGKISNDWPHLNPRMAAQLARESGAKKLVLTHFDAGAFPELKDRKEALACAKKTFKNTICACDGLSLKI